jgi:predicted helicase
MLALERVLAGLKHRAHFEEAAAALGPKQRGDLFELLTKHYLLLQPEYRTELFDVWLLKEVPQKLRAALNLPDLDQGIDLIAKVKTGG